ncbi:MAG: FAD-dependent oxidoreductase [Gammaproteobacteria bacterium]|nr:FAD-dependent oxidoreductase [Gammaproteobacteria bacterium]
MSSTRSPAAQPFRTRAQQLEKLPPCQALCPNSGDVRGWLGIIAQHEKNGLTLDEAYDKAWEKIAELNPLPATMGRICPHPCEDRCTRRDKDGSISIHAMERFLGDWGISRALRLPQRVAEPYAESIGVIGSGPASLSFAYQMARRGYAVTIYERHDQPGGMLRHAIPDYRLPREVLDTEVQRILALNISLVCNVAVGGDIDFDELRKRHKLMFLGLGAQAPRDLGIPGETGPGVISGIEYLQQRKRHLEPQHGQRVIVVGGGNTAIDAARTARREGARVTLLYRRSEKEMPAAAAEVEDACAEGVQFRFLVAPTRILRDDGIVQAIELQAMHLGEPGEHGRRRPMPVPNRLEEVPADRVIVAVSQAPDWRGLEMLRDAHAWLRTRDDGKLDDNIWAGGDDRGLGIASQAIAQGRLAAETAHAELRGESKPSHSLPRLHEHNCRVRTDYFESRQRADTPRRSQSKWLTDPELEIELTVSDEQACREAARCMSCGKCFDCQQCFMYCNAGGFTRIEETQPGHYFAMTLDACEGCGKCIEICPCGYLESRDGAIW